MADKNMKAKMNVEFTEATSRQSIESGDSVNTLFGKIKKFFSDLKSVAFSGSYNDLSDKPTIPTKTSQLTNDSGYKTTDNNTTYSLSKSGTDIILTGSDGSKTSVADTNTWRGIQDNLTSTSTTDSLSANQGKALNEKIDGIQVGGRNLIQKSVIMPGMFGADTSGASIMGTAAYQSDGSALVTNSNSNFRFVGPEFNVAAGEVYTISAYYKEVSGTQTYQFQITYAAGISGGTSGVGTKQNIGDGWIKSYYTFIIPTGCTKIKIWLRSGEDYKLYTHSYYVKHPKLELGNKATDWTPAPEDLALADHTHSKVQDSNSGADTTFSYSKAGMNYADYSWLAGWNGGELRAVNKSQFAQASHTHSYAASSSVGGAANSANVLNRNSVMNYGWNGLNYFNFYGTAGNAAKTNDTPTSAWWHILRFNHNNPAGYYTDLAIPFNDVSLYYKRICSGSVQNNGWVKVLDALNYTSYTVTKTGSGASGSWGISVTGSSASCTGNASTATALTSSAGSATQPVYFSGGKPVACTYTLGKSVPSDAVFTDTHFTTGLKVGASSTATANAAATNGNVYLNVLDNTTIRDSHKIVGSGATTVTSDASGNITISSTDNNTDTKVTQTAVSSSTSGNYPLLLAPAGQTTTTTTTAKFYSGLTYDPSTYTLDSSEPFNIKSASTNIDAARIVLHATQHQVQLTGSEGIVLTGETKVDGTLIANNIVTGTKTVTLSSATTFVNSVTLTSTDLGFTPTANTSVLVSVRKLSPSAPLHLNVYAAYYNNKIYLCISNGASTSTTVPAGTYMIDYIVTNNA